MYVFRPQQGASRVSNSCGGSQAGCHAARLKRRVAKAQPPVQHRQRRLPPAHRRRRLQLRDACPRQWSETTAPAAEEVAAGSATESNDDFKCGTRERKGSGGAVHARLRNRLVERRTDELVATLERRYGDGWVTHILEGNSFRVHEELHRLCEALNLRPDLERRVFQLTINRARSWGDSRAVSPTTSAQPTPLLKAASLPAAAGQLQDISLEELTLIYRYKHGEEAPQADDDTCTLSASTTEGCSDVTDEEDFVDAIPIPLSSHTQGQVSKQADQQVVAKQPLTHLPLPASRAARAQPACPSTPSTPSAAPTNARQPWRIHAMQSLGLDRLMGWASGFTSSGAELPKAAPYEPTKLSRPAFFQAEDEAEADVADELEYEECFSSEEDLESGEEEERLLCGKLVAAVRNAHTQAALARQEGSAAPTSGAAGLPSATVDAGHSPDSCGSSKRTSRTRIAGGCEICFFVPDTGDEQSAQQELEQQPRYERKLYTKLFDGPSAHKAKHKGMCMFGCLSRNTAESEEDDSEEEEEWEDRCDDIADLMSQERSLILWSNTW